MKELLLVVLRYYVIVGCVCALLAALWVSILSVQADLILNRGNTVKVMGGGPTFYPGDYMRMQDYLMLCLGFGTVVATFLLWPLMLHILIFNPKKWCVIKEVKVS